MKLLNPFKNVLYGTIFLRYFFYGIGFAEILILPKILDRKVYASFEYNKNLILLFPYILLGAHNGYIYLKYAKQKDAYQTLFSVGITVSVLFAIILGLLFSNYYLIIPFLAINFFTLIEQKLKVDNQFLLAFTFKPLISLMAICIALLSTLLLPNANQISFFSFLIAFLIWIFFVNRKKKVPNLINFKLNKFSIIKFYYLIKLKFTDILASLTLASLVFFERFLIEKFYVNQLASYSLAFNISQILTILLSVFTYISSIKFGEQINIIEKKNLVKYLKILTFLFLVVYISISLGLYFFASKIYSSFDGLIGISIFLLFSKGFLALSGIFSPIAFYKDYNSEMFKVLLIIFIINIPIGYIAAFSGLSLKSLLIIDSLFIIFYSFYILDIVFRRIHY